MGETIKIKKQYSFAILGPFDYISILLQITSGIQSLSFKKIEIYKKISDNNVSFGRCL